MRRREIRRNHQLRASHGTKAPRFALRCSRRWQLVAAATHARGQSPCHVLARSTSVLRPCRRWQYVPGRSRGPPESAPRQNQGTPMCTQSESVTSTPCYQDPRPTHRKSRTRTKQCVPRLWHGTVARQPSAARRSFVVRVRQSARRRDARVQGAARHNFANIHTTYPSTTLQTAPYKTCPPAKNSCDFLRSAEAEKESSEG